MANVIKLHKGLNINLKGKPAQEFFDVKQPDIYAIVPDDFHGVTPKVVVKEQEYVTAGGTLFVDKNHPEVKFVSPVSGVVTSVERGERRKVLSISIAAAKEQDYEEFGKKDVSTLTGEQVKAALHSLSSAPTSWWLIRMPSRKASLFLHLTLTHWLLISNLF